jgi:DNA-binding response OmpR family regulator
MPAIPKIGQLLKQARLVDEQQIETALSYQQARGGKLGEILVSLNYLSEQQLLETLSRKLDLPLADEAHLLKLGIPAETRSCLPRFLVEEELIFPLEIDRDKGYLSIVTHEPLDDATLEGIRIFANVKQVKTTLTTKATMRKLLAKHLSQEVPGLGLSSLTKPAVQEPGPPLPPVVEPVATSAEEAKVEPEPKPGEPALPPPPPGPASFPAPGSPLEGVLFEERPPGPEAPTVPPATGWDYHPPAAAPLHVTREGDREPTQIPRPPERPPEPPPVSSPPPSAPVPPRAAPSVPPVERSSLRVLIVHPDQVLRTALAAALSREGCDVAQAASAGELGALEGRPYEVVLVPDPSAPEARALAERLRTQNPFLDIRSVPAIGPTVFGWTVDAARQFQFLFDLWDIALRMTSEARAVERQRARARAELARDMALQLAFPARMVEEIYLGTYLQGTEDLFRSFGFGQSGENPLQELLTRTGTPYRLEDFLNPVPEEPPREGAASIQIRIAAAAASYLSSGLGPGQAANEVLRRLPWCLESPDLAGVLLRTLARRGDVLLPEVPAGQEVVLVDSDRQAAEMLWLRFVSDGTAVRIFPDARAALEHLATQGAALVISEVDLPGLNGIELCAALKSQPRTAGTKFFFVSREADPQVILRGLSAGADDYLIKPVHVELLLIKARRAVGR